MACRPLILIILCAGPLASLHGCGRQAAAPPSDRSPYPPATQHVTMSKSVFGTLADGTAVDLFTMTNSSGMQVSASSYGAIITSIKVPDRNGEFADVALGHDSLEGYLRPTPYFGAVIGRYANRIGNAQFTLDGATHALAANDGPNTLHGGIRGFDKVLWQAEYTTRPSGEVALVFMYTSADGEEGFPGTLAARVTYTLTDRNELLVDYFATTDRPTVVNLTQHTYFNLGGEGSGDVLSHRLLIHADRYTPVDATLIPLGSLANVEGTPFDFRTPAAIGARIEADHPQIKLGKGYDHNYVLNAGDAQLALAARLEHPDSGRVLEIRTSEPGLQLYTGNSLDGSIRGKSGRAYGRYAGVSLEPQHFPDSPNQPSFPSTTLRPGEQYISRTVYTFSAS